MRRMFSTSFYWFQQSIFNQYSKMAISSLQLQKKWKTILDWSGLRKRSCRHMSFSPLMLVSKGASCSFCEKEHIFSRVYRTMCSGSAVSRWQECFISMALAFPVPLFTLWEPLFSDKTDRKTDRKNVHESPLLAIFSSVWQVVICLW